MRKILLACIYTVLIFLIGVVKVHAQITWDGGGDNINWSDAANWHPNGVPTATNDVLLTGDVNVVINISTAVCRNLTLNSAGTDNRIISQITFTSTGHLTVTNLVSMPGNGNRRGGIIMTAGGYLRCGGFSILGNNPGTWEPGSGTVEITGTGILPAIGANGNTLFGTFNNLIVNGGVVSLGQATTVNGSLTISTASSRLDVNTSNFQMNVAGNWNNSGTFVPGAGTVIFNGTNAQTISRSNFNHIVFNNGGAKTATGNLTIAGDVTINSNFNAGSSSHTVGGNWTNSGSGSAPFSPGTSTITFNGAVDQEIRSENLTKTTTSFHNFVINKPGGRLRLAAPVTINNQAGFMNGIVDLVDAQARLLFLENGVISPSAQPSNNSHVNGPVQKMISGANANASSFVFPVGKNGRYVPISVSGGSGLGATFIGEYFPVSAYTLGSIGNSALRRISNCEYWRLDSDPDMDLNLNVTLGWGADNACTGLTYISEPSSMRIAALNNAGVWNNFGGTPSAGATAASGSVSWTTGPIRFNAFTLGTSSIANSLPVTFANFTATQREEGVSLSFSNLTEEDVALYHVERSANGTDFQSIGTIAPLKNNISRADYTFLDKLPLNGASYYRIRALETNGKVVYSNVVMLRTNGKQDSFVLYPNPAPIHSTLSLQMGNLPAGRYQVKVFNQVGQLLTVTQFSHSGGFVSTPLSTQGLAAGSYFVELSGERRQVQRLVLR